MHETMTRLYMAAKAIHDVSGQSAVAKLLNKSPQALNNWESRGMSASGMLEMSELLGCNADWLKTGRGEMRRDAVLSAGAQKDGKIIGNSFGNVLAENIGQRKIPVIGDEQVFLMTKISDITSLKGDFKYVLTDQDLSPLAFCIVLNDDSMTPDYRPGDRIIADPDVTPRPGDFVVAVSPDKQVFYRKYRPRGYGDTGQAVFELAPLNDDFPPLNSDRDALQIVGVMVEHRRYRRK